MKTDNELLVQLRAAAARSVSPAELREQRLNYVAAECGVERTFVERVLGEAGQIAPMTDAEIIAAATEVMRRRPEMREAGRAMLINPILPGFVKPDTDRQVFFYEQDFYVLSNFSAFRIRINTFSPLGSPREIIFDTSEAAYHWYKFIGNAPNIAGDILTAPSAHEAFKIAERNKVLRRPDWDDVKVDIMRHVLRLKVQQHEYVRRKLLATGDRELIEDSWRDDFWGWGPNRDGQNMLGKLWMEVRAELRAAVPESVS